MRKILILLPLLLAACTLEPRYRRCPPEIPCTWRVESSEMTTLSNARWWLALEDPVLDQLVLAALENNKDLKVAIWRVCDYWGKFQVVRSPLFPQINFQGVAEKEKFSTAGATFLPPGFNPITPEYKWQFNLSWEIDLWGKIRSAAHAAFAEFLASIENRRGVVLTLVSSVAQAYIFLRELDKELEISINTMKDREEAVKIATYRFDGGLTSEIELTQAISAYEEAAAEVATLEEQIPQQENLISVLIGESPKCILRGKEVDAFTLPLCIPAGIPSEILFRRPDIIAAEEELLAANADIGVARAQFFPDFSITGLYGGDSTKFSTVFSGAARMWNIAGNVMQPLFTGGKLIGQLTEANAEYMEALYHYQQVILNAFREVDDALIAHQQAKILVEIQTKNTEANREYLKLAWYRYYEGQNDYLTVLNAEDRLFTAELNLAQAEGNVFLTLVDVYKALGGGWVIDADTCLTPK